ncbi:hypothetical protein, partial [Streptomyces sp. NPDC059411]|uniref:hypothetical protein n=1 Tax=Streptomyces sp. NPDC059411 TaxID=3346825 RepID=UPI00369B55A3
PAPARPGGLPPPAPAVGSPPERFGGPGGHRQGLGPRADALRAEVERLAERCATAAGGFDLAAAQLAGTDGWKSGWTNG